MLLVISQTLKDRSSAGQMWEEIHSVYSFGILLPKLTRLQSHQKDEANFKAGFSFKNLPVLLMPCLDKGGLVGWSLGTDPDTHHIQNHSSLRTSLASCRFPFCRLHLCALSSQKLLRTVISQSVYLPPFLSPSEKCFTPWGTAKERG